MRCSQCQKKLSFQEIWVYLKIKFTHLFYSHNVKHFDKPLCKNCYILKFLEWTHNVEISKKTYLSMKKCIK